MNTEHNISLSAEDNLHEILMQLEAIILPVIPLFP